MPWEEITFKICVTALKFYSYPLHSSSSLHSRYIVPGCSILRARGISSCKRLITYVKSFCSVAFFFSSFFIHHALGRYSRCWRYVLAQTYFYSKRNQIVHGVFEITRFKIEKIFKADRTDRSILHETLKKFIMVGTKFFFLLLISFVRNKTEESKNLKKVVSFEFLS